MKNVLFTVVVFVFASVQAKTVALWPLEVDASGNIDARCLLDPENDLTAINGEAVDSDIGWNLPPNPDQARHAYEVADRKAAREVPGSSRNGTGGAVRGFLSSETVGRYMRRDRAFTLEGWIKFLDLPQSNAWGVVAGGLDNNNSQHRWTLSFRRRPDENYACTWILWAQGNSGDKVLHAYESESASFEQTNRWMHVALTHAAMENGHDGWTFYLDGEKISEQTLTGNVSNPDSFGLFDLGARRTADNPLSAEFNHWRLSDRILAPSEFLCAGGTGTTVADPEPTSTVAYWPLGVTPAGGIDGRDAVGEAPLSGGFLANAFYQSRLAPCEDCAFAGNPPNTTVTLSGGNAGCLEGSDTAGTMYQYAIGTNLNLSSSFTVECWYAPRLRDRTTKGDSVAFDAYLFGTRPDGNKGWSFQYQVGKGGKGIRFDLYCVDQSGNLQSNPNLTATYDMMKWYETWHHVALVYDKTGGANAHGRWTLFIDGAEQGHSDNSRDATVITDSRPFLIGGRGTMAGKSVQGKIDCARVSLAALSPNQFLCATENPQEATNVVGFWPLNVKRGAYWDLQDVSGRSNHFMTRVADYQMATSEPDVVAPVISNPDTSPAFRGNRRQANGSVCFRDPNNGNSHRSYLLTGNTDVMNTVSAGRDFTFECYYRRRQATDNQEVLFATMDGSWASPSPHIRIFRKKEGINVWENRNCANGALPDTLIPGTSDSDLLADQWYHLAFVHAIEAVEGVRKTLWRVYVNGALKGTASANYNGATSGDKVFVVGGRFGTDKNSVIGNLSSLRLSNRALASSEFLCATPSSPVDETPQTVAYWPIDDASGAGLANLIESDYPLQVAGNAAGQAEIARNSVPNHTTMTNLVTGSARRNIGSYLLGAGDALKVDSVGFEVGFARPFTVEGWLKWTPSDGTADEDLVNIGETASGAGIRIFFDKSGAAPRLKVWGCDRWPATPFVEAAFDADLAPYVNEWTHFAVAYDPTDHLGAWTLYADGKQIGSKVRNFWSPNGTEFLRSGWLRIGSSSAEKPLCGAVDMWRLSTGVLEPAELLYAKPRGMVIYVR